MIHNFSNITHWTQVVLVVYDTDRSSIAGQYLDLGIAIKGIGGAGSCAVFELDHAINCNTHPGLFQGNNNDLNRPMAGGRDGQYKGFACLWCERAGFVPGWRGYWGGSVVF